MWKTHSNKDLITAFGLITKKIGDKGLFDDICKGILESKIILVFLSDEYILSETCMKELKYGITTLKKQFVVVIVGKSKACLKTTAGFIVADALYIDCTSDIDEEKTNTLLKYISQKLS